MMIDTRDDMIGEADVREANRVPPKWYTTQNDEGGDDDKAGACRGMLSVIWMLNIMDSA